MDYVFDESRFEFRLVQETGYWSCLDPETSMMSGGKTKDEAIANMKDIYEMKGLVGS